MRFLRMASRKRREQEQHQDGNNTGSPEKGFDRDFRSGTGGGLHGRRLRRFHGRRGHDRRLFLPELCVSLQNVRFVKTQELRVVLEKTPDEDLSGQFGEILLLEGLELWYTDTGLLGCFVQIDPPRLPGIVQVSS